MEQAMHERIFEFAGGQLCLDFANTVGGLRGAVAHEYLTNYADLARWSHQAGVITEQEMVDLMRAAADAPNVAADVLRRAYTLREAIYAIFTAVVATAHPPDDALDALNEEVRRAMAGAHIITTVEDEGFVWAWGDDADALDLMLGSIARSAAMLLTSDDVGLVRICASETCGWLFVDATKNHRRRWCTMAGCGNRARVHRHRQRTRDRGESQSAQADFVAERP
jgi:predicted RNA-binding Zn ribbon-like protein